MTVGDRGPGPRLSPEVRPTATRAKERLVGRTCGVATALPAQPAARRLPAALQSLRHRNYRLLWIGTLISNSGDWMDQIALNWLVYELSGSAVQLALLNLFRLAPIFVFTLVGGVVADRTERRRLLFTTQLVAMLLAFILATLTITGLVRFWMVFVIA